MRRGKAYGGVAQARALCVAVDLAASAASDSEIQGSAASICLKFRTVVLSLVLRLVCRAWFNAPGSLASWRLPPVAASAAAVLTAVRRVRRSPGGRHKSFCSSSFLGVERNEPRDKQQVR